MDRRSVASGGNGSSAKVNFNFKLTRQWMHRITANNGIVVNLISKKHLETIILSQRFPNISWFTFVTVLVIVVLTRLRLEFF